MKILQVLKIETGEPCSWGGKPGGSRFHGNSTTKGFDDDYGVGDDNDGDGDKDDDGDHLNFTRPPKVFEKLHETKLKAWKIFKEIIIDARIIKCSVHYLIWHLSDMYFVCADPVTHFLGHSRGPFHHTLSSQVKTH